MSVLSVFLPVILAIALGYFFKRKQIISAEGIRGINALITNLLLPVVLFRGMATIEYSTDNLVLFFAMLIAMLISFGIGFFVKRFMGEYSTYTPWLNSGIENGMLGFSLFTLLAGAANLHYIAAVDMGNAVFANSIYLGTLAVADGGKIDWGKTFKGVFKIPAFLGTILGIAAGITGLYPWLMEQNVGGLINMLLEFVAEPLTFLVLFAVGYKFTVYRELIGPVIKTVIIRIITMAVLYWGVQAVVFSLMDFDPMLQKALIMAFALPASFVVPIYTHEEKANAYSSTTLSVYMIVTIAVFTILAMIG